MRQAKPSGPSGRSNTCAALRNSHTPADEMKAETIIERIDAAIASARAAGHPVHYVLLPKADLEELNVAENRSSDPLYPGSQWRGYFLEVAESLAVA